MAFNISGASTVGCLALCTQDCIGVCRVGGKCSICGEPYDRPNKVFEKGGAMYIGKIVKTYTQGQQIDVTVVVSPNDSGSMYTTALSLSLSFVS